MIPLEQGDPQFVTHADGLLIIDPGQIITQTLETIITFSGVDETSERFTVSTSYPVTVDNFASCE